MTKSIKRYLIMFITAIVFALAGLFVGDFTKIKSARADNADMFTVEAGASIRLDTVNVNDAENSTTGIRFAGTVKPALSAALLDDEGNDAELGMSILPATVIEEFEEQNAESDLFKYIQATYGKDRASLSTKYAKTVLDRENDVDIFARLVKIFDDNYGQRYQAVAYYTLDGGNTISYSNYSEARSFICVADSYLQSSEVKTSEQITAAVNVVKKTIALANNGVLEEDTLTINKTINEGFSIKNTIAKDITATDLSFAVTSGEDVISVTDGAASILKTGEAVVTVSAYDGALSFNVNITAFALTGKYYAAFDDTAYESLVYTTEYIGAESVRAEYLESFAGEPSVLKVTAKTKISEMPPAVGASFGIKLPKAVADGKVKVKMYFPEAAAGFQFMAQNEQGHQEPITGAANAWHIAEVNYGAEITQIPFSIFYGTDADVDEFVMYFSWIAEPTDMAASLTGNDLADFSSVDYEGLVEKAGWLGAASVNATYMESFAGETNVLKVTTTADTDSSQSGSFRLNLPKASTNGKVKVKLYFPVAGNFKTMQYTEGGGHAEGDAAADIGVMAVGAWHTLSLDYEQEITKIPFTVWANGAGAQFTVYFSFVEQQVDYSALLAAELTGDYLADFSRTEYEEMVYVAGYLSAESVSAQYMTEGPLGEPNVLMVTSTATASGNAAFGIRLPKASAANGKLKVKMYFPANAPFKMMNQDENAHEASAGAAVEMTEMATNTWHTITLDYGQGAEIAKLPFSLWGLGANAQYTVYFSFVRQYYDATELANTLTGNYLADFSNGSYEYLVCKPSLVPAASVSAEYMPEGPLGETNVLKVTTTADGGNGSFAINLPKASAEGKIRIRIYFETQPAGGGFKVMNNAENGHQHDLTSYAVNTWHTIEVDYNLAEGETLEKVAFSIWTLDVPEFTMYISFVEDVVEA